MEEVAQNIRKIRELKNFTQEHLSSRLGISIRAYSKIESGETQLTLNRLNQISEVLEVPPQEIMGFDSGQIFNHCKQSGNIETIYNSLPDKLIKQYEKQITHLQEEVAFLREQLRK
jgi:transcriptional regulator with XRE-family HTH domain